MNQNDLKWERVRTWLLWLALPLLLGILIASVVPQPVIGIIRLDDAIYPYTARDMITQINYAIDHPEIRAVVLAFDSPGGTVVDTEAVYMELARLREKKPVVTAVNGMAASGAYYLSAGTDYIFAKPTSLVGNIGVISYLPSSPFIFEEIISTGPYKLWGAPRDSEMRQPDMIKEGFFKAVMLGRGDRIKVGPEVVLSGQIWIGSEAVRIGIADKLGSGSYFSRSIPILHSKPGGCQPTLSDRARHVPAFHPTITREKIEGQHEKEYALDRTGSLDHPHPRAWTVVLSWHSPTP
jgi:signal peptide peptidase SppA